MTRTFVLLSLISVAFTACEKDPPAPLPRFGTANEPITYTDFEDIAGLFTQQSDTTYLINFWATWCKPCREELPLLNQLAREEQDKKLKVVLVSLDTEENAIGRIPAFLRETAPDLASIILTDEDQSWGKTIDRVWSGSLPTTIIYRADLRYVYRRGFNTYPDVRRALEPLIGK
ncbi:redoxin domain-containing protein [Neolewinella aurantiaca]|uniref:Redoxin domain-containing protein n=1 Tax=Neolewinella aurantiaca TaxID=2602767 RepID=A0A5C7FH13_9BACT|nr:TlpA family protein disulfide reductase [Neolewinella aurantiaca]TXF89033.1 redoxin domain-containing protein [Neolewinella aurantiaca]